MIDTLDSRALRLTDCYGQRFMKAGVYRYHILPVHGDCVTVERPFTVQVVEGATENKMKQHTVVVMAESGKFKAEPSEVVAEAGDLVMWNCPDPKAIPYMVVGDKPFFASHRLVNESGYSHAFGLAGEYRWVDAYGSSVAGVVRVENPECKDETGFQEWHKLLTKGTLVMVDDGKATPREVDIVTGQTVFFAVRKGPGISITDERLLVGRDSRRDRRAGKSETSKPKA